MKWLVNFYNIKTMNIIQKWPLGIKTKFTWIVDLIEKHGPKEIGMPYVKAMGDGLFEIRVNSKDGIGRAIFCMLPRKRITILTGFIKKTEKTPQKEMKLSVQRMKEVKNSNG